MYGLFRYFETRIKYLFLILAYFFLLLIETMARSTRRRRSSRRSNGLFSKIYGPVSGVIGAVNDVFGTATNTAKGVVRTGLRGVNRVGRSVTGRANKVVRNLVSRKNRKSRKNRNNRKNRKSRRNRR